MPSASARRDRTRLRWSSASSSVTRARLDAALLGEQRGVDVGDLVLGQRREHALERGSSQDRHVVLDDLAAHLDVEAATGAPARAVKIWPSFSVRGSIGRTSSAMAPPGTLTASGTSSPPSARRTDLRDGDTGLLLGLVGGRAEVRGDDDLLEGRTAGSRCTAPWRRRRCRRRRPGRRRARRRAPPRRRCRRGRR